MLSQKNDFYNTASRIVFFGGILLLFLFFVSKIKAILTPFILSFIIAYVFAPLSTKLQNKFSMGDSLSSGTIIIALGFILALIICVIAPLLYIQVLELIKIFPVAVDAFENSILPLVPSDLRESYINLISGSNLTDSMNKFFLTHKNAIVSKAYTSGRFIVEIASVLLLTPILVFYLLRDWKAICSASLAIIPLNLKSEFEEMTKEIRVKISAYMVGELYAILILTALYGISIGLTGLKFGFFIGALTGLFSIIPYIGFSLCLCVAGIIAFVTKMSLFKIIIVFSTFFVIQAIESNYIVPKLVGGKVGLHPFWIIFGLLSGGVLLGFAGLLLAIPLTAIISVLINHYLIKYKNSKYYEN